MLHAMRSVFITRHGGPEVLEVREGPDPAPGPGEVRVRVRASGLNFADVMGRLGIYPDAPPTPCVMGYEVSGVVDAAGEGVTAPRPGERVVAMTRFGGHADVVVVPAAQAIPLPEGMSFEVAAAIPVTYLTAWHMLFAVGHLSPGQVVLVHMAAGGVGIAALQLARTVPGVTVLGTASAAKHEVLREEGCHHPIDYRTADYAAEVRRLTGGKGVHLVLDALGGADWRKGYGLLRPAGMLVAFGVANMASGERRNLWTVLRQFLASPRFSPIALMNDNRAVAGVNVGHLWGEAEMMMAELQAVLGHWRNGVVRPRIDSTYPLERAAEAHRRLQSRQSVGKILHVP
jgi:NADPH:quinone reductase-like Zn-dependent oxidoreductase